MVLQLVFDSDRIWNLSTRVREKKGLERREAKRWFDSLEGENKSFDRLEGKDYRKHSILEFPSLFLDIIPLCLDTCNHIEMKESFIHIVNFA